MRDIIKRILSAEVPVATWVREPREPGQPAPALTFFMPPILLRWRHRPTWGAATPVQIGGGGNDDRTERSRPRPMIGMMMILRVRSRQRPAVLRSARRSRNAVAYIRGLV